MENLSMKKPIGRTDLSELKKNNFYYFVETKIVGSDVQLKTKVDLIPFKNITDAKEKILQIYNLNKTKTGFKTSIKHIKDFEFNHTKNDYFLHISKQTKHEIDIAPYLIIEDRAENKPSSFILNHFDYNLNLN